MNSTAKITEKLALLNSQSFMWFWKKGGEPYNKVLQGYLNLSGHESDKSFLKILRKEKGYDFNEYDLETIKVDAQHLANGESLTNERKMGENPQKQDPVKQVKPEEFSIPKVTPEQEKQVNKEFKEHQTVKPEEEPLYQTKQIAVKRLSIGDIIPFEDLLWAVIKKQGRYFAVIQELYSGRTKRFDLRGKGAIDVLTDDQTYELIEEFKKDKSFNKLPKILQDAYQI